MKLIPFVAVKIRTVRFNSVYPLPGTPFLIFIIVFPALADGATADPSPFGGVTDFLRSITNLLILEWGYYIGIITLAIQGYRWKTGRIDLMQLGGWGLGIGLVFFAPNIVADLKSHAGSIT